MNVLRTNSHKTDTNNIHVLGLKVKATAYKASEWFLKTQQGGEHLLRTAEAMEVTQSG